MSACGTKRRLGSLAARRVIIGLAPLDLDLVLQELPWLAQTVPALLLLKLLCGVLRRRHATVDDHAFGQPDSCLHVPVLSDYVFGMGETLAGGVLDAPSLPRWRPFDFRPDGSRTI
jgi:hypothetical protein